ncbi:hypothetical protein ONE63_005400 [Megalurothrips usitatus]|uniref:Uncharacterized protein n=1 Tax=Megalurothrips usitatus TaxID=439358 RepID=A0AAV7Y1J2_9NEOP|nr:hypothetical protein ONE63_005400 [Megalurothrips usitatus]
MAPNFVLVLWTKAKKTNVVPEDSFEKAFKSNGKKIPLREGDVRKVVIEGKRYEAKVLRICPSKKYLQSLVVTKEGKVLMHGTKPPLPELIAKRSKLVTDDTAEQKAEKKVMRALDAKAEEQPPNVRLNGLPECNDCCSSCCSKKTLPHFPKLPEGFVTTLVSLAEYFQHFHKSTAMNILAASKALANLAGVLHPWQMRSDEKVELKKGSGVWINSHHLQSLVAHSEQTKKPPHQTVVKSLLTYLLGKQAYMDTSAEKIDRRLMEAVTGFANDRYPTLAQPIERYYRGINLNRTYMLKRKYEVPDTAEAQYRRQNADDILTLISDLTSKRPRLSSESQRNNQLVTTGNPVQSLQQGAHFVKPTNNESDKSVAAMPPVSSASSNKYVVLPRPVQNTENIQSTPLHSNLLQSDLSLTNNNRLGSNTGNVLASSNRLNVQHAAVPVVGTKPLPVPGNANAGNAAVTTMYSNAKQNVPAVLNSTTNIKSISNSGNFMAMTSSLRPVLINNTNYGPVVNVGGILANTVRPISTPSGTVLVTTNRLQPSSGNILVRTNRVPQSIGNILTTSVSPQTIYTATTAVNNSFTLPNSVNVVRNSVQPNLHVNASTLAHPRSLPNSGGILIKSSATHQRNITSLNQHGSFRYAAPSATQPAPASKTVQVKTEEIIEIDGALDITL